MAVYVDALFDGHRYYHGDQKEHAQRTGSRHGHQWSHMMCDTSDEELHAMARKLGLRRSWFQGDHYDLVPTKRARAIALGAIEVDTETMLRLCRRTKQATLL